MKTVYGVQPRGKQTQISPNISNLILGKPHQSIHTKFLSGIIITNHPLFTRMLKVAEQVYEFDQKLGPINIPCHVDEFCHVMGLIQDLEQTASSNLISIPIGSFLAVTVGQEEEQKKPFVIPVKYVNHPLFMRLLKVAEEEYDFEYEGPINIPCHVEEFRQVRNFIAMEETTSNHLHHRSGFKAC